MQRRAGKAVAHISIPPTPGHMGSESEKAPSRLHQKSLGVTNRIWLILVAFVALIVFTRSILPTETSNPRHRLLHTDLKPKNYLNISDDSNPFPFCPALGPGDELASRYDPIALSQTRFHTGSGARIQRVINKALAGLPVTISVIGGSGEQLVSCSGPAQCCASVCFLPRAGQKKPCGDSGVLPDAEITPCVNRMALLTAHFKWFTSGGLKARFLVHLAHTCPPDCFLWIVPEGMTLRKSTCLRPRDALRSFHMR